MPNLPLHGLLPSRRRLSFNFHESLNKAKGEHVSPLPVSVRTTTKFVRLARSYPIENRTFKTTNAQIRMYFEHNYGRGKHSSREDRAIATRLPNHHKKYDLFHKTLWFDLGRTNDLVSRYLTTLTAPTIIFTEHSKFQYQITQDIA